jgi:SnoaL-like protein
MSSFGIEADQLSNIFLTRRTDERSQRAAILRDNAMTEEQAEAFAREWIAAWNAHDLSAILSHYSPDIEFLSPVAQDIIGHGRVVGLSALRSYWTQGLQAHPTLKFDFCKVLTGYRCVTILYRNHRFQEVAETCEFGVDGKVVRSFACYRAAEPRSID